MVIIYALLSALSFGTADFLGGFSSRRNATTATVAWSQGAGLLTVLIAAPLMGGSSVVFADLGWGILGGMAGAVGVVILFHGLSTGLASIVSPVAALSGAVLPVLFGLLIGERPPLLTWMGVVLSLPAILLLSWEKGDTRNHVFGSVRLGLLAGFCFGGFFILISRSSGDSGMWPLVTSRVTTVPLFVILTRLRKSWVMLQPGTRRLTLLSGALDMAANVFYLLAARTGYLIIAVILSALYPAPTVVLQRLFLHEKLTAPRIFGLVLSITGAALIGAGG